MPVRITLSDIRVFEQLPCHYVDVAVHHKSVAVEVGAGQPTAQKEGEEEEDDEEEEDLFLSSGGKSGQVFLGTRLGTRLKPETGNLKPEAVCRQDVGSTLRVACPFFVCFVCFVVQLRKRENHPAAVRDNLRLDG